MRWTKQVCWCGIWRGLGKWIKDQEGYTVQAGYKLINMQGVYNVKGLILIALVLMNLCLLCGFADLNRDMSATRAELAQARQDAARNSVELVKAQTAIDILKDENIRLDRNAEAVYSQVKELRFVVEGVR